MARYTTGPISSSDGLDEIHIELLNNSSRRRTARVRIYDLDQSPKALVFNQFYRLDSRTNTTVVGPALNHWEVRITTNSNLVYAWVGGRSSTTNLVGNIILHKDLIRV
jgi:hypothetical protein